MIPDRFVRSLDAFESVLLAVPADRWLAPSPCDDWAAIDVAGHVIAGLLLIEMRAAGTPLPDADPGWRETAGEDPVATWRSVRARMTAALGPDGLARRVELAFGLEITVGDWLEQYPLELLVHAWDLAEATGQTVVFDPDLARGALESARRFAPRGREAGMLKAERAVPGDADDQARLLALMGRG
ncbi:TIGR03086 family metal-binding protein [Spirillospora sp. CA-294931]|uniref:TIGR03086 family metal-binding protein n=1 Tax=Spirillospora sp. CA-294931 TaxID=3240042 RepID=UPI003D8D3E65